MSHQKCESVIPQPKVAVPAALLLSACIRTVAVVTYQWQPPQALIQVRSMCMSRLSIAHSKTVTTTPSRSGKERAVTSSSDQLSLSSGAPPMSPRGFVYPAMIVTSARRLTSLEGASGKPGVNTFYNRIQANLTHAGDCILSLPVVSTHQG